MNVGLLTPSYGPEQGPLGRDVHELARAIVRAGGRAEVLVPQAEHTQLPIAEDGVLLRSLPLDDDGRISQTVQEGFSAHEHSYDLIHAHGYPTLPTLRAAGVAPRRLVFSPGHVHEQSARLHRPHQLMRNSHRRLTQWALGAADLVVCVSREQAAEVRRRAPRIVQRVRMVPGTAELTAIEAAEPFATERRVILTIDSLQRGSGVKRIISTLPDLGPECELVVIGQGRRRRALAAHAADLEVADQVRFLGAVQDSSLHRWLRTASVVVSPSQREICSPALLGAIATGLPAVAANSPAHRDVAQLRLARNRMRLVEADASPLKIAEEIACAMENACAPASSPSEPTWETVADHTVSLYETLIAGSPHATGLGHDAHRAAAGGGVAVAAGTQTPLCAEAA
jgi:glycosyltransferase involved in cell wall biosynthesis